MGVCVTLWVLQLLYSVFQLISTCPMLYDFSVIVLYSASLYPVVQFYLL